jgi:hypothetical protein
LGIDGSVKSVGFTSIDILAVFTSTRLYAISSDFSTVIRSSSASGSDRYGIAIPSDNVIHSLYEASTSTYNKTSIYPSPTYGTTGGGEVRNYLGSSTYPIDLAKSPLNVRPLFINSKYTFPVNTSSGMVYNSVTLGTATNDEASFACLTAGDSVISGFTAKNQAYSELYDEVLLVGETGKVYKNNGGVPELLYDAGLSVNYNLFTATATLNTQTVTLPVGTFTLGFASGGGSIMSAVSTAVAAGLGTITAGQTQTITVTVAGMIVFTVIGTVNQAQLNVGSSLLAYRERTDGTAVKPLNLGSTGAINDGTNTLGTTTSLLDSSLAELFGTANILYSDTGYTLPATGPLTVGLWFRATSAAGTQYFFSGATATGTLSLRIGSSRINFLSSAVAVIATSTTTIIAGVWYHLTITIDASKNYIMYINGASEVSGTTALTFNANTLRFGARNTGLEPYTGSMNSRFAVNRVMTATQIANIYNSQKAQYGY